MLWYHKKIGAYDLQIWEKAVELQEKKFKGIDVHHKQESKIKSDLIDVDLVRGSTFSKNKPQHNVLVIMWMGFVRVAFLPFFITWWVQQANLKILLATLFLYFSQLFCVLLYWTGKDQELALITQSEVALPSLLMLVLGLIHCQVVSTNFVTSYRQQSEDPPQKRTLSKALLQPAKGTDCKNTLSFVTSSVRNIDSCSRSSLTLTDDPVCSIDDEVLLENVHDDESSCGELSENDHPVKLSPNLSTTALLPGNMTSPDRINIRMWEGGQWKKCHATLIHIGGIIIKKVDLMSRKPDDYYTFSIVFPMVIALLPSIHRLFQHYSDTNNRSFQPRQLLTLILGRGSKITTVIMINALVQRFVFSTLFFVMLRAAQQTYRRRFLYAKYFTHLTSGRRAKKSLIAHFRLNKVQHIRVWLALRSYLRRRGPQRSIDVIVSSAFLCSLSLLCFITIHLMNSSEVFVASLLYWDCLVYLFSLAVFILHFITIGAKINKKYNSISTLLTEQINLHLQMEKKPEKKERLQRANNVLTLAAKLIKEIEEPFNIYGLAMSPILYNITRVVLLSAFSGVVSEMLGFKLKIWKIKA